MVAVKKLDSDQKEVSPNHLIEISVRGLHHDMIKTSDNDGLGIVVDSVTLEIMISDTTLRLFIPLQVRKKNPRLRQICGCDILISPKVIQIDFNRPRTKIVTDLQQKYVRRNTCNSEVSTTSASH